MLTRVDEEWHVVGDDVDDRVRRVVPVLLERRGVHPYERLTGLALLGEPQVRAAAPSRSSGVRSWASSGARCA